MSRAAAAAADALTGSRTAAPAAARGDTGAGADLLADASSVVGTLLVALALVSRSLVGIASFGAVTELLGVITELLGATAELLDAVAGTAADAAADAAPGAAAGAAADLPLGEAGRFRSRKRLSTALGDAVGAGEHSESGANTGLGTTTVGSGPSRLLVITGCSCATLGDSIKRLASFSAKLDEDSSCVSMVSTGAREAAPSLAVSISAAVESATSFCGCHCGRLSGCPRGPA
jgi:hypothetical protein